MLREGSAGAVVLSVPEDAPVEGVPVEGVTVVSATLALSEVAGLNGAEVSGLDVEAPSPGLQEARVESSRAANATAAKIFLYKFRYIRSFFISVYLFASGRTFFEFSGAESRVKVVYHIFRLSSTAGVKIS